VKVTDGYPKKTVNTFRHKGRFGGMWCLS